MPENRKGQINAVSNSSNASTDNLEDSMCQLKIQTQDIQEGVVGASPYPDRPGEPNCLYYLRTGLCGYGNNCRFNHPAYAGKCAQYRGELPQRVGQPDCQYFLKTGTCKFGPSCKFHHPQDKHISGQIPLNVLGLPMRQEEKSCPYYMRTWSCKFGASCKFHHPPPPPGLGTSPVNGTYGSTGSSVVPPTGLPYVGGLQAWSLGRTPAISGPTMQGSQAYMPVILSSSQGILPTQQRWNTFMGTLGPVSSTNNDGIGSNVLYISKNQTDSGSSGQVNYMPGSPPSYPERPDQPECQYYMKTGSCGFGSTCKYHHPKERIALVTNSLGPYGLPLRPGQAVCMFYSMYGICKFGATCKFDHPLIGYYGYGMGMPSLPIPDPALFPFQRNSSISGSSSTSPKSAKKLRDKTKTKVKGPKRQSPRTGGPENPPKDATSPTCSSSSEKPQDRTD